MASGEPMLLRRHLVLIGPMASGKSTLGSQFANRHGLAFADSDKRLVERHGPIPAIFTSLGEHAFRELEAREVAALLAEGKPPAVVSLGGGAILDTGTQQLLANCTVVFLDIDVDTVRPRIIKDTGRPLLAGDPVGRWTESLRQRRPVYERLADLVLDTRGKSQQQLLAELKNLLEERHEP
ncbi:shikimate kinase [Arthrobacter sulfonylureivorans]|uniref:Shikimate kinase n=1 Tax=Arthrobacter sulfonylureivorans TaxID=2486855 RepID=A0ABY3W2R6_9MICC|nr:shikimate kinase [Arthrobacter sulfonylureivorans]UNK44337.1 shikimate kinase [Arthrobacter sulfonylureivorans]